MLTFGLRNVYIAYKLVLHMHNWSAVKQQIKLVVAYWITAAPALFCRVFGAVVFTALSLGRASSFAPDASKAQASASRILFLLRRKPVIDATSPNGQKLVCLTSTYCSVVFLHPLAYSHLPFAYSHLPSCILLSILCILLSILCILSSILCILLSILCISVLARPF